MKSSLLNKIAKSNKRLSNDHYKQMIKNSPLIHNKTPVKVFKEAFHSKETPSDYRTILLSSLYKDRPHFAELIRNNMKIPSNTSKISLLPQTGKDGRKHFELMAIRKAELSHQGVYKTKPPFKLSLSAKIRDHVRNWAPSNLSQRLLNTALQSNNVQFQKVTVAMENISRCLFDLARLTKLFALWNDPLGLFNTSPTNEQKMKYETANETGYYIYSAKLYMKHQEHTYNQLQNYMPILEKMGIDTLLIKLEYDAIQTKIQDFIKGRGKEDTETEITSLYDLHNSATPFIESILDIAEQVESLTEYSPEIYKIRAVETIPAYVPYTSSSRVISRSQNAVDSEEGILDELDEILEMLRDSSY